MKNKKNQKKNRNNEIDEDILNDVRNLFIAEDEVVNAEGNYNLPVAPKKDEILFSLEENENDSNKQQQPAPVEIVQVLPVIPTKSSSSSSSAPIVQQEKTKPQEQEMTDTKKTIPSPSPSPQPSPPAKDKKKIIKPPTPIGKQPVNNPTKTTTTTTTKTINDKCKNNGDCDNNLFCMIKTGKCTAKFTIGQSGCTSNDQCESESVVCDKSRNKCLKACQNSEGDKGNNNSKNCDGGQTCFSVKDLKIFEGLKYNFNGVCDTANSSKPIKPQKQPQPPNNQSKPSTTKIAMLSGSSLIILTFLALGFIYLRGYLKRRNRDNNPEFFLFDGMQKSSSQAAIPTVDAPTQAQVLHSKLSGVGGARFTRWGALTPNNR